MTELKTKKTTVKVTDYLNGVEDEKRRADSMIIHQVMQDITGEEGTMWGESIIGYGTYHYVYESGREGDWMVTGFSPRKNALSIYIMSGFTKFDELMSKLGKYKAGKGCLYVKKLEDVDMVVLRELITSSVNYIKAKYEPS